MSVAELTRTNAEIRLHQAFVSFGDELVRALGGLLGDADDAQDVAQETFLKCWRSRDRADEVRDMKAWLFRVGLNAARDLRRNAWRKRSRPLAEDSYPAGEDSPVDVALYEETLVRLNAVLERMRPEEREVFVLRHQGDLTYEQIAQRVGAPLGTVKTRMRTALGRLRRAFARG